MIAKRYDDELMYSVQRCEGDSSNKYCTRDGKLAFKKPGKDFLGVTKQNYKNVYVIKGELVYDTWICPRCGTRYEIGYDEYEYCPKCGQHIDLDSLEQECEDTEDEE